MAKRDSTLVRLLKSERVLDYDLSRSGNGKHCFTSEEDGTQRTVLMLNSMDMQDFGQPLTVTVTIEPGDRLNKE